MKLLTQLKSEIFPFTVKTFGLNGLTLYYIITPLKYQVFENIIENGAFAHLEQMLHFPKYFQKYSIFYLKFS